MNQKLKKFITYCEDLVAFEKAHCHDHAVISWGLVDFNQAEVGEIWDILDKKGINMQEQFKRFFK